MKPPDACNSTIEIEPNRATAKLSLDARHRLFLFYKEAIHNVHKHSQANQVSIRLCDEDDKLALEILDNGVRLSLNDDTKSMTVHKLEDRARVLDGLFQIASTNEIGIAIRPLVKRFHFTAYPTPA